MSRWYRLPSGPAVGATSAAPDATRTRTPAVMIVVPALDQVEVEQVAQPVDDLGTHVVGEPPPGLAVEEDRSWRRGSGPRCRRAAASDGSGAGRPLLAANLGMARQFHGNDLSGAGADRDGTTIVAYLRLRYGAGRRPPARRVGPPGGSRAARDRCGSGARFSRGGALLAVPWAGRFAPARLIACRTSASNRVAMRGSPLAGDQVLHLQLQQFAVEAPCVPRGGAHARRRRGHRCSSASQTGVASVLISVIVRGRRAAGPPSLLRALARRTVPWLRGRRDGRRGPPARHRASGRSLMQVEEEALFDLDLCL